MKKLVITALLTVTSFALFAQNNYTKEWKRADSLLQIQQPKSAEKIITKIYDEAQAQNNVPQLVKAYLYRFYSQNLWSEEGLAQSIAETEAAIAKADVPTKNILHSIAADFYWRYYYQNQWKFYNRTQAPPAPGGEVADVRTMDLRTLIERCVAHYKASLAQPQALQQTAIEPMSAMLQKVAGSEKYRPTLYDFLAFRAVEFYNQNVVSLLQPAAQFTVTEAAYFAPAADFSSLKIATPDTLSFKYQALTLLQQIIAFHLQDADPTALLDADLQRLDFVYQQSTIAEKDNLYLAALQSLDARYAGAPSSTEILFRIANLYNQQGGAYNPFTKTDVQWKKKEAMAIIEKAMARFPESFGAKNCAALKSEIQAPELTLKADEAVLPNKPLLASLSYKNVSKIYYRIVPLNYKKMLEERESNENLPAYYSKIKPMKTGEITLPAEGDFQPHNVELALPELNAGYYGILVSTDDKFSDKSVIFSEAKVWATAISYVQKTEYNRSGATTLLLNRETGQPMRGVRVQTFWRVYDYNKRKYTVQFGDTLTSNTEGIITLKPSSDYRTVGLYFTNGKDNYASDQNIYLYRGNDRDTNYTHTSTTFFTDRAIYRPGQTVYFKGLVMVWKNQQPKVVAKSMQTVTFYNVNHEKISDVTVTSNEFGSFAGSFAIPTNVLTGYMSIQGANGSVSFRVEEYKRPKFEVTFKPVEGTYKLGEKITVTGHAKAYAGSAVSDSKVVYRVVRQARYPYWCWWWGPMPHSPAQEITNGESETKADGSFDIAFTAIPDPAIAKKESPLFTYTVYATVSDINGETHEAQTSVTVGYKSLLVSTTIPEKVDVDKFKNIEIKSTNLNGQAQPAQGTVTIWKLRNPSRILQDRRWERPDKFLMTRAEFEKMFPNSVYDNEDNVGEWEKEAQVASISFDTKTATTYTIDNINKWAAGNYLAELKTQDASGEAIEITAIFTAFTEKQKTVPANKTAWFQASTTTAQPGDVVKISMGSAFKNVYAVYEIVGKNNAVQRKTIALNDDVKTIEIPVTEQQRGNFGVNLFFVKNNRSYNASQIIQVPFDNKKLNLEFATFRDKLQPGQDEEWRITIKDKAGDAVAAELLASMYDASLDVFVPHNWSLSPWQDNSIQFLWNTGNAFNFKPSTHVAFNYPVSYPAARQYSHLLQPEVYIYIPYSENEMVLVDNVVVGAGSTKQRSVSKAVMAKEESAPAPAMTMAANARDESGDAAQAEATSGAMGGGQEEQVSQPVQIRKNFNETAFFYPQLSTNEKGETVIRFTIPEALTRWKMQGLAWTQDLKTGSITKELVTQKDLMIFTNAPRFFRENDTLYFSAKLSNISDKELNVKTQVQFFDALTMKEISTGPPAPKGGELSQTTTVEAGGNKAVAWKIIIPEGLQAITYRITATSASFSDGEENTIPVLTNRMLVTESLPLPIRGNQTKSYEFTKLLHNESKTLKNYSYTIEFTSNPAWYAVQALPYIMEYPYECSEQAFSRYYANSIATHVVNSDPKIKQVFDIWRNYQPDALLSNLEKNEELKSLLLEETPWVRAAKSENDRKQRIAVLFDLNRMSNELGSALRKVEAAQTPNGGFAWFKGGPDNRYITQHIVSGFGHLQKMQIKTNAADNMLRQAVQYMDARAAEDFADLKKQHEKNTNKDKKDFRKEDHLCYLSIHYLYARSFFVKAYPVPAATKDAFDFYKTQAATYWTKNNNYMKGMLALALNRHGDTKTAKLIMKSLNETALHSDEMGMYWKPSAAGWWWYQAPIETQALMIEAYNEVLNDQKAVDDMKVWLLKQKQTEDWKTTKATSEAVYALLSPSGPPTPEGGEKTQKQPSLLSYDKLCEITVDGKLLDPNSGDNAAPPSGAGGAPEAGTGYFKTSWKGDDVNPGMGKISVTNPNPTVAWGAAYWQYFEQLDKITPAETGVKITKKLFVKTNSPTGPVLNEIKADAPIKVGDKITVRVEIRSDRDMEYVHLKDMRAAAFEPVNVLSGYRWQDGLGYYESTRDAATNFFISYLPKGTYVFEYDLFATQEGEFSNGITTLQCMYAPEFTTHSEGIRIRVGK